MNPKILKRPNDRSAMNAIGILKTFIKIFPLEDTNVKYLFEIERLPEKRWDNK